MWAIRPALSDSGPCFEISEPFRVIDLVSIIYYDKLTKDRHANEIHWVKLAVTRVGWILDKKLGSVEPSDEGKHIG